jgi:Tfp pilus assembly protein PilV
MKTRKSQRGQTILEVVTAVALISISVAALVGLAVAAVRSSTSASSRSKASSYAEEGLEAVRSIRDRGFLVLDDCLTNICASGTCGLAWTGTEWECHDGADTLDGFYTRGFTLTDVPGAGVSKLYVQVDVSWNDPSGSHTVSLDAFLTDWR